MSKDKLLKARVRSENAKRLQQLLLDYHYHRQALHQHPLKEQLELLGDWQAERLKHTHADLYHNPRYHEALDYLLKDLYSPKEFSRRDSDVERVFPVMVKLLPDQALGTIAGLVELNLLSQQLDLQLTQTLFLTLSVREITETSYAQAYRLCDNRAQRLHQIHLFTNIGRDLERYVSSRLLAMTLKMTERPAYMAGVGELHSFLSRGFHSFRAMGGVEELLDRIIERELQILERIHHGYDAPFALPQPIRVPKPESLPEPEQMPEVQVALV